MKRTFDRETVGSYGAGEGRRLAPRIHQRIEKGVDFIVDSRGAAQEAKRRPERRQVKWEDFGEES